ncbi:MAG: kelch repeat-containing protein, partial [Elusimicrobiota bacterium]|nr:kelch repeat-containing protein [Elusimicrobiota bacterium]
MSKKVSPKIFFLPDSAFVVRRFCRGDLRGDCQMNFRTFIFCIIFILLSGSAELFPFSYKNEEGNSFNGTAYDLTAAAGGLHLANELAQIYSSTFPEARHWHGGWSGESGFYIFGGKGEPSGRLGDTWLFEGQQWQEIIGAGPAPRSNLDIVAGGVLFGGIDPDIYFSDTWIFSEGSGWTEIFPSTSPPGRYSHSLTYIPGGALLFGGATEASGYSADTWEFDSSI